MKFKQLTILEPKPYLEERKTALLNHAESVAFFESEPLDEAEVITRLHDSDAVVIGRTPFRSPTLFDALPKLRYLGIDSTDFSLVDLQLAGKHGVAVTHTPGYATHAVVEYVFAQLLTYYRRLNQFNGDVLWGRRATYTSESLAGKTMGIIGLGRIGSQIARVARSFGMTVLAHTLALPPDMPGGPQLCDLEKLLRQSDIVVLVCDLNPESFRLLNAQRLALLKPSCVLVNVARGEVVDCDALQSLLDRGALRGAILDVFCGEPKPPDHVLHSTDTVFCTPHIAWKTRESLDELLNIVLENMAAFLRGERLNRVQ